MVTLPDLPVLVSSSSVTVILQWERKANLSRFEGSSSISSADYFGTGSNHNSSSGSHLTTPDLEDVKESVRQGVTKVAGKLSSLANGVMSSIQVSRWFYFSIYLSGSMTAVAVSHKPNTIPLCFSIDFVLYFSLSWLRVLLPSMFF
jgi:hypothetical protein